MAGRTQSKKLTDLQLRFCREYAKDLNGEQAYIRAGYTAKDSASARAGASTLLTNPNVRAYLGEILGLNEVTVIAEVVKIALCEITEIIEWNERELKVKDTAKWSPRARAAVKSFTVTTTEFKGKVTTATSVVMHSKLDALKILFRKLNLYPKDLAVLDAVQLLLNEGVATDAQAAIISNGVAAIKNELKALQGKPIDAEVEQ